MYVTSLRLRNIRCFEKLDIEFGAAGQSILIIGDNGDGKSTVLRSLAMGLCDEDSAAALFRELPGDFVRKGTKTKSGTITVELADAGPFRYRTVTEIRSLKAFEQVEQTLHRFRGANENEREVAQKDFPWDRIFVTGYGAGIRTQGTADFDYYLPADAVYPLFRYDTPLQNPELVIRRLIDAASHSRFRESRKVVLSRLKALLKVMLQLEPKDKIELTSTGIVVGGRWGKVELGALGDGYRSTVTWVLDLLSWWFIKQEQGRRSRNATDVRGLVLIDEAEQHLHPRWQRRIMRLLTQGFPRVQFVATTHSPLVASGCEGIPVHHLDKGAHTIEHPFGWLAEDVYEMMGVPTSRAEEFRSDVLQQFELLDAKRLRGEATDPDLARLRRLGRRFHGLPSEDPIRLLTEIENIRRSAQRIPRRQRSR